MRRIRDDRAVCLRSHADGGSIYKDCTVCDGLPAGPPDRSNHASVTLQSVRSFSFRRDLSGPRDKTHL